MLASLPNIDISLLQFEIKVLKTLRGFLCKNSMCICWLLSVCRLVLRNVNKTDISIEKTVYYISQYRLLQYKNITVRIMRLNRFMYYNNQKFQKRLMAIQPCLFLLFERTTTSLSLAKLNSHIIKRYVKAIFGEYLVNQSHQPLF